MVDAVMTTFIQYLQTVAMRVSQLGPLALTYGMIATRGRKRRATTAAHETTSSVVMSVGTRAFFGVAFEPFAATAATAFPIGETENRPNRQYIVLKIPQRWNSPDGTQGYSPAPTGSPAPPVHATLPLSRVRR